MSLKPGIVNNLPLSGVKTFVGREDKLKEVHEALQQGEQAVITAVKGMGGVGKTELALQYGLEYKSEYPGGICWCLARGQDLGVPIINFARIELNLTIPDDLDLKHKVRYCWKNWPAGNVLLILDDVVDYQAIKDYLPSDARFRVLITTREKLGVNPIDLDVLSEGDSLILLSSIIRGQRVDGEFEQAKALCEKLGYLPLGLELVGRFLENDPDTSVAQMLAELTIKHDALDRANPAMTATNGVQAAFELSWERLDETARELACLLSLFAQAPIAWTTAKEAASILLESELIEGARRSLLDSHLVQRRDEGIYQLHQLIREFLQLKSQSSDNHLARQQALVQVMIKAAKSIPFALTLDDIARVNINIPHLQEVANNLTGALSSEDLVGPFVGLGRFHQGQGLYALAEPWYLKCLGITQSRLGEEHSSVATSLNNLAELYRNQGKYAEAEPLYERALRIIEKVLGPAHPNVATSLNNLAGLYYSRGRYDQAEAFLQQALKLRRKLLGEEHPDLAQSLNNLAGLYESQGKYEQAEPYYLRAVAVVRRSLGIEHPSTQTFLRNFYTMLQAQGRCQSTEEFMQYVVGRLQGPLTPP